jgi:hypothetical protein
MQSENVRNRRQTLIVEHYVQQRTVNLQCAFCTASVMNKTQLSEAVHEEADPGARSADHLG